MSDLMLHAVLNTPPDLWDNSPLDVIQRYGRYKQASERISDFESVCRLASEAMQLDKNGVPVNGIKAKAFEELKRVLSECQ